MQAPLVSVIIPVYNHAQYVVQALDSVFEQTYPHLEIIIIDDGSKDQSATIVEKYLREHKTRENVVFIRQENRGAHATINRGLEMAHGELLTILNSDDYYATTRLEKMVAKMQAAKAEIAFSGLCAVDEKSVLVPADNEWNRSYHLSVAGMIDTPTVSAQLLRGNFAISTGNFIFTKKLLQQIGNFKNYKLAHDYDFLLRAVILTEPLFVRENLYFYRLHGDNSFTKYEEITKVELNAIYCEYFQNVAFKAPPNRSAPCHWYWPHAFGLARKDNPKIDRSLSNLLIDLPIPNSPKATGKQLDPVKRAAGKKITLVSHELSLSGAPKVVYDLALTLKEAGYLPEIIALQNGALKASYDQNQIPVKIVPSYMQLTRQDSLLTKLGALFLSYFYALWHVRRTVIVNSLSSMEIGIPIGMIPLTKRYWFIHESYPPSFSIPKKILSPVLKLIKDPSKYQFLFGSKSTKALWADSGIKGNLLYWSGIEKTEERHQKARPIKNLLAVGSINARKGIHTLVDAFIDCVQKGTIAEDVVLTIVGFPHEVNSSYQADIILKVHTAHLQNRIRLAKMVPLDALDALYDNTDLFIQASNNECLPLVLLTAMSKGLPIVSTDAFGCGEALEDQVHGYVVPVHDAAPLARAIAQATNEYEKSWEFGQNAQKQFNAKFSLQKNKKDFFEIFKP